MRRFTWDRNERVFFSVSRASPLRSPPGETTNRKAWAQLVELGLHVSGIVAVGSSELQTTSEETAPADTSI